MADIEYTDSEVQELASLYRSGQTLAQIATKIVRSTGYVARRVRAAGVQIRKPGRGWPDACRRTSTAACGTVAGHMRHVRADQQPCAACRKARNAYDRAWKRSHRKTRRTIW